MEFYVEHMKKNHAENVNQFPPPPPLQRLIEASKQNQWENRSIKVNPIRFRWMFTTEFLSSQIGFLAIFHNISGTSRRAEKTTTTQMTIIWHIVICFDEEEEEEEENVSIAKKNKHHWIRLIYLNPFLFWNAIYTTDRNRPNQYIVFILPSLTVSMTSITQDGCCKQNEEKKILNK